MPQQWDRPRGERIAPEPVSHMVSAKPGNVNRKWKPIMAKYTDNRNITVSYEDRAALKRLKHSGISSMIEHVTNETVYVDTQYGPKVLGSALSYIAPLMEQIFAPREEKGCGNHLFPQECYVTDYNIKDLDEKKTYWSHLKLSIEQSQITEKNTRDQSLLKEWFEARKDRITASRFGDIMKRKNPVNEAFLRTLCDSKLFETKQTSYGHVNEKTAKTMYLKKTGAHLHDVGLIVNPNFPFLGASPNAIVCKDGHSFLLEVKCPYSARDMNITQAVHIVKDFFLEENEGIISLKRNHKHFYQMQGQILVSGASHCDFVTFTRQGLQIERIQPDYDIMNKILNTMITFFVEHFQPYKML